MIRPGCGNYGWRWSLKGIFTVADTDKQLAGWQPKDGKWLLAWKFNGAQRFCHFIWLLTNERLFTKDERSGRGLAEYPLCKICEAVETNPDVVRDCCSAKALRNQVLPTLGSFLDSATMA